MRKADGTFAVRRRVTFAPLDMTPAERGLVERGHTRPHLLDWDGDGRTDLVLSDPQLWRLRVGRGPLAGKDEVAVKPFPLPELPGTNPLHFEFTDWDGDGRLDLVIVGGRLKTTAGPWVYEVYWLRNTSARGEPAFEPPASLLAVPEPWEVNGLAFVGGDRRGRPDLVISVTKDWHREPGRGWTVVSQHWRYRRATESHP